MRPFSLSNDILILFVNWLVFVCFCSFRMMVFVRWMMAVSTYQLTVTTAFQCRPLRALRLPRSPVPPALRGKTSNHFHLVTCCPVICLTFCNSYLLAIPVHMSFSFFFYSSPLSDCSSTGTATNTSDLQDKTDTSSEGMLLAGGMSTEVIKLLLK